MKRDLFLHAICGIVLSIYLRTLSPSISGGDSGEIVAEGCKVKFLNKVNNSITLTNLLTFTINQLGTAHPPGYPLILLLIYGIKCVIYFLSPFSPQLTVALGVNAFCAFCTTLAAFFLGLFLKNIFLDRIFIIA